MTPRSRTIISGLAVSAAGLLASVAPAPRAAAQCSIFREGVPDFDQERDGLPGAGGMYCVPTSAADFLAYISNNGLPQVFGGPFNWQLQQYHGYVTGQIEHLGDLMDTSATNGTTNRNGEDGLESLFWDRAPFLFTVSTYYGYVRIPDVYDFMADNRLVLLCYGYYQFDAGTGRYSRNGGHCVALTGLLNACSSSPLLRFRDPADDSNLSSQSTFSSRVSAAALVTLPTSSGNITRWRLTSLAPSSTTYRCVDVHITIRSRFAIYPSAVNGSFVRRDLINSVRAQGGTTLTYETGNGLPVDQAVLSPVGDFLYYTTTAESPFDPVLPIYRQNVSTGVATRLANLNGGTPLAMDRFGDLYMFRFGRIRRYDVSGGGLVELASFAPEGGQPPDAMVWDDGRDQLVAITQATRKIQLLGRALNGLGSYTLPGGVTDAGQLRLDVTDSGTYVVGSTASGSLYHLRYDFALPRLNLAQTFAAGGGAGAVRAVQAASEGSHLCVMTDAGMREFGRNPTNGLWEPAATPRFGDAPVCNTLVVSEGRTNYDAALHSDPGWNNVLVPEPTPAPVPDCPADLNMNGVVEVADVFVYLRWFFANEPAADFDASGEVVVADIFAYLRSFFGGCP